VATHAGLFNKTRRTREEKARNPASRRYAIAMESIFRGPPESGAGYSHLTSALLTSLLVFLKFAFERRFGYSPRS